MLMYALIGLCLILLGIVGLQFTYLFYVDRMYNQRRAYLHDLERRLADLKARLAKAEARLAETDEILGFERDETWAEVIEER